MIRDQVVRDQVSGIRKQEAVFSNQERVKFGAIFSDY